MAQTKETSRSRGTAHIRPDTENTTGNADDADDVIHVNGDECFGRKSEKDGGDGVNCTDGAFHDDFSRDGDNNNAANCSDISNGKKNRIQRENKQRCLRGLQVSHGERERPDPRCPHCLR